MTPGDDVNLAEVKAILGRLQRISRKPGESGTRTVGHGAAHASQLPQPAGASAEDGGASAVAAFPAAQRSGLRLAKAAVVTGTLAAVVVGAVKVGFDWPPAAKAPSPEAGPRNRGLELEKASAQDSQKSAAQIASEMMASGKVQAARAALLHAMRDDSPDVAWALARSYDPNFLVMIPGADAAPDVTEATRWYRTWYGMAVKQGLVSDSVSLDRIIRAMN